MPKLDWIGKQYVVNHSDEVPFRLLEHVPEASMGEGSGNVIVHGDNLEALKRLVYPDPFVKQPRGIVRRSGSRRVASPTEH
jgi:hypothetical protein